MSFRSWISRKLPPFLYSLAAVLFWFINPRRETVFLIPRKDSWYVKKGDMEFFLPIWERTSEFSKKRPWQKFCKIKEGQIVVDAGAGIGLDTVSMAKVVGGKGRVIAIEPHPISLKYLRKNVECNNLDNVKIVEKGLWRRRGTAELFVADRFTAHSMIKEEISGKVKRKIIIRTDSLDNILSESGMKKVDLIKMDIEGAEIEALKGSKNILRITEKVLIETHHDYRVDTAEEVVRLLRLEGFRTRRKGAYVFGRAQKHA
ncbi:hypothetical protein AKJ42_03540 [candidate division MSBL1 archaeon SCGC-AAA261C02]|uniref:Methyltransferase FkbM domain-containing protein n=1 Tax=candidate division MSBL1 archaeon SCGC-AAA261C02 TaxID=1698272 RepID=A0A133UYH3_9EURY|nr:hypothetical protein AKJ42_03540 [candidate division MSBL1 archaeon SCGC-AAA261C02]